MAAGSKSADRLDWRRVCQNIETDFLSYFANLGFRRHPEAPLIPRGDRTLLLTNAFIVGLKPLIRENSVSPTEKLVMRQSCLRTQNLKRHSLDRSSVAYGSSFDMLGGLVGPTELPALLPQLHRFLSMACGSGWRLHMKGSTRLTPFFVQHYRGTAWQACSLLDTEPTSYYQWRYGEPELGGSGVTFGLRAPWGDEIEDVGNIVELRYAGRTVAYEFGFGVETLVCRRFGLSSPVDVSVVSSCMPEWRGVDHEWTRDLTSTAHALFRQGVRAGKGGVRHLLRTTCRHLAAQIDSGLITNAELECAMARTGGIDVKQFMHMFRHQQLLARQVGQGWT